MTTSTPSALPTSSRLRNLSVPAVASVINLLIMIPGYSENGRFQAGPWFIMLAISLVVGLALSVFVVPHAGRCHRPPARRGGAPFGDRFLDRPHAADSSAAAMIGWREPHRSNRRGLATAAVGLAVVSAVALIAIIIIIIMIIIDAVGS